MNRKYVLSSLCLLAASLAFLVTSCADDMEQFASNHRSFHEGHALFLNTRAETTATQLDRLAADLEEGRNHQIIVAEWNALLGILDEIRYKSEVYIDNCLASESTLNAITGMQTAAGELSSFVLVGQTEIESAIRRNDYTDALSRIQEIGTLVLSEISALSSGAVAYLAALEEIAPNDRR